MIEVLKGRLAVPFAAAVTAWVGVQGTAHAWHGPVCALEAPLTQVEVAPVQGPRGPLLMCLPAPTAMGSLVGERALGVDAARQALLEVRRLERAGRPLEALLHLRIVEGEFPRIADHLALIRGDLLLQGGRTTQACEAFTRAVETSIDGSLRARGRVALARCLMRADRRDAETYFQSLLRRYPELPGALSLRLELGEMYQRRGDPRRAEALFRQVDLEQPGSPWALRARAGLANLVAAGHMVRGLTDTQRVDRLEKLVRQGPMPQARDEVQAMLAEPGLQGALLSRVHQSAARIARVEGRFEDVQLHLAAARGSVPRGTASAEEGTDDAIADRDQAAAMASIRLLKGRSSYARLPQARLSRIIEVAARAELREELDQALAALVQSRRSLPTIRMRAAILASGVGNEEHIEHLLAGLVQHPSFGLQARYHHARSLERLGRYADAERELVTVMSRDRSAERYYSMWAEQRLWFVREALLCSCDPNQPVRNRAARAGSSGGARLAALNGLVDESPAGSSAQMPNRREGMARADSPRPEARPLNRERAVRRLDALVEQLGDDVPRLGRAYDLLRLGEHKAANDELYELQLDWRAARGTPTRNTGLEAVYRGDRRPNPTMSQATRRALRQLSNTARQTLIEVAVDLGDEATATGFSGFARASDHPRAYEHLVNDAARRHGLDPNLLLAVMRVESVYQRQIISYAGAVGLMQIMPRTGRLIADRLGRDTFTTADLLEPEVNIEFAAWYLASLIERFDGRLPLAIASYNGGPHNVRKWLHEHGDDMQLDAFLERIPFSQTHRYVRRVLTHYREYRAQQGLPMEQLSVRLPTDLDDDRIAF